MQYIAIRIGYMLQPCANPYILRIADLMNIDLEEAIWKKMKKNAEKYPVEKAKGNAKKYTEL